jgi:hypothetical protein
LLARRSDRWRSPPGYELIDPQVSVEAEKLGVKDDASLAHWKGLAATPNASLADGDQSLELELQEEPMLPPESLSDGPSLEAEDVVWSSRLPRNSRKPIVDSPERLECRDYSRELMRLL